LDGLNLAGAGFRIASVFIGIAIAYLAIAIYNKTKGGSQGWIALLMTYVSFGFWAILQVVFLWMLPNYGMRVISATILFFVTGFTNPLGVIMLSRDMKLKRPAWFNKTYCIILSAAVYLAVFTYNFVLTPFTNPFAELLSTMLVSVGVLFLFAFFGYYIIYRGTKLKVWLHLGYAILLVSLGVFMVAAFSDCCGTDGPLHETEACDSWMYDYTTALPAPCIEWLLPLSSNGALFIFLGEAITLYALFRISRSMD
jgi:hypothetical protein